MTLTGLLSAIIGLDINYFPGITLLIFTQIKQLITDNQSVPEQLYLYAYEAHLQQDDVFSCKQSVEYARQEVISFEIIAIAYIVVLLISHQLMITSSSGDSVDGFFSLHSTEWYRVFYPKVMVR